MKKLIQSTRRHMATDVAISIIIISLASTVSLAGTGDDSDSSYPEVGVEWVNDYSWPNADLSYCDDSANGLYNKLGNIGWSKRFNNGDSNAKAAHFEQANQDSQYIDAVDLALYSGHGSTDKLDVSTVTEKVYYNEAAWGDSDLEWIGLDCCLAGSGDFASALNGVHLICGFSTTISDTDLGLHWADYMVKDNANDIAYTVKDSWFYGADVDQSSGVVAKVYGETLDVGTDYIWGQGSVHADPIVDDYCTVWTYNI